MYRFTAMLILVWVTASIAADTPQHVVDYATEVRPIFANHCNSCHGENVQSGNLRLDAREAALRGGDSGAAIVAGKSDVSPLFERLTSDDSDLRMPQDGKPLSAADIQILKDWIDQGSRWPDSDALPVRHWSLRPLVKPAIPMLAASTASVPVEVQPNPIDAFIRAKLDEHQLRPSPEADRRTLIRRLSFDLIGLPPTPEEVEAFVNDNSAAAYERLVDRLLASPRYGERWARHWIDVVHWAETHGHDQDRPRPHSWPYRDYLIQSFNSDKPYSRFVSEQVAGDALYPDDPQATTALGLLASGPWDESSLMGILDDTVDRKLGQVLDRDDMITTVMSTFCSATVHCARCHNHKFDPITQADYYALQAVFSGVDRTERSYDVDAATHRRRKALTTRQRELQSQPMSWFGEPEQQTLATEIETLFRDFRASWRVLDGAAFQAENGSIGTPQTDGSLLFAGERPEKETYQFVFTGNFHSVTAIQIEAISDPTLPFQGPGRQDNGNFHLSEMTLTSSANDGSESQLLKIASAVADFNQTNWEIAKAIDGRLETAWGIYPEVGKSHAAVFVLSEAIRREGISKLTLELKQLHGGGHLIGRPRISVITGLTTALAKPIPIELTTILELPREQRSADQQLQLAQFLLPWHVERELDRLPAPQLVYAVADRAASNGVPVTPPIEPRPVHLLRRGDINQPMEEAVPGTLSCFAGLPSRFTIERPKMESTRRAALARWLVDSGNVLVWRSIVNRIWHYHFGRGIVDTPNDLGSMGGTPSHPELLDWLAVEFRDAGGSFKSLHKRIVMSQTYRQVSKSNSESAEIDRENRFLWRMNANRLDAESVRDSLLQISGKIDLTMGGPSVKQFIETPGIHVTPNVDYQQIDIDSPVQYRRSIYRFLFRTLPDPFMASMDCPDASQWAPTRSASVTALQALSMLNNRFVIRQSEHLATRLSRCSSAPAEQVRLLFQLAVLRNPDADESQRWQDYAARHGMANACLMMFNTNEFMFVR